MQRTGVSSSGWNVIRMVFTFFSFKSQFHLTLDETFRDRSIVRVHLQIVSHIVLQYVES